MARPVPENRQFKYDPLPGHKFIRLLVLHPARDRHEPVICDLITRPLHPSTAYAALSYSWGTNVSGDASLKCRITVKGKPFPVTQNLFEALQRLRSSSRAQPVWIDAICINQNDTAERNAQVSRMAQIYAYAGQVVAWLGEGRCRADDTAALAILRCLREAPHRHHDSTHVWHTEDNEALNFCGLVHMVWELETFEPATETWLLENGFRSNRSRREQVREDLFKNPYFENHIRNIARILNAFVKRRYFTRRWIVQELFHPAPESIIFAWGPCTYSIKSLTTSLDLAHHFLATIRNAFFRLGLGKATSPLYVDLTECDIHVCDIYNMLEMKEPDEDGLPLYNVLHRCSSLQCSDPRDVIFAVCSLDPDFGLKADYGLSVEETYAQFTRLLLQRNLLELLLHNLRNRVPWERDKKFPHLSGRIPSWMPNISKGFIDPEIAYASLSAEVGADEIMTCTMFHVAHLQTCERSNYGQLILSSIPGEDDQPLTHSTEEHKHRKWLHRRSKPRYSSLGETPLLGMYFGGDDPLWDARPGDIVCATRADCLQDESPNRQFAEVVLLRPVRGTDAFSIAKVFSSQELKYFGPNEDAVVCRTVEVKIM